MPFAYTEDLPGVICQARQHGIRVFAAHLEASENYTDKDYTGPCAFLIGNEGRGLRRKLLLLRMKEFLFRWPAMQNR
jgi:TrmH family RNA methyltransferase